jgi:secondary thiamine-phosphate synthase enzyme
LHTYAAASTTRHALIHVTSRHATQFIDLTDRLDDIVAASGLRTGLLNVQTMHTTTAIVVNEREPLLHDDFARLFERTAPIDQRYDHDDLTVRTVNLTDDERANGHAHCRALVLPTSVCLNVVDGRMQLGCWQRVFLVELDGPRMRAVSALLLGGEGWR